MRRSRNHQHGFTLVETLAVVSILALVVSLGLGHFATSAEHARLRETVSELCSLDARARILARSEGSIEVCAVEENRIGAERPQVELRRVADGAVLSVVTLPAGASLQLSLWNEHVAADVPRSRVVVNRLGEADDVLWTLAVSERRERWVVLGTTGEVLVPKGKP